MSRFVFLLTSQTAFHTIAAKSLQSRKPVIYANSEQVPPTVNSPSSVRSGYLFRAVLPWGPSPWLRGLRLLRHVHLHSHCLSGAERHLAGVGGPRCEGARNGQRGSLEDRKRTRLNSSH